MSDLRASQLAGQAESVARSPSIEPERQLVLLPRSRPVRSAAASLQQASASKSSASYRLIVANSGPEIVGAATTSALRRRNTEQPQGGARYAALRVVVISINGQPIQDWCDGSRSVVKRKESDDEGREIVGMVCPTINDRSSHPISIFTRPAQERELRQESERADQRC